MNPEYLDYLDSIKVGDTVYPCYDAKFGRATSCKVLEVKKEIKPTNTLLASIAADPQYSYITVIEGSLWGDDTNTTRKYIFVDGELETTYEEQEPTTMQLLEACEDGDFYRLQDVVKYKNHLNRDYVQSLGITQEN